MPKNKLNILIIGTVDNKGGAAGVGWTVGEGLRALGHDVKYIVGYKFSRSPNVYELSKPPILGWLDQFLPIKLTPLFRYFRSFLLANDIDMGASREILSHPWYKRADIIHCHNLHGSYFRLSTLATMAREKRVVWTLHDMWAITGNCVYTNNKEVWQQGISTKTRMMEYPPMLWNNSKYLWENKKSIYAKAKDLEIVVPSIWLKDRVTSSILKDKSVSLIHNGIDTSTFIPGNKSKLRTKLNLPKDKRIIAFVAQGGEHDPRKGWSYIADIATNHLNDANLLFLCIGGKEDKEEANIRYIANINDPRLLSSYYAASDVFLFTSLAENCPLVILEALSCGLPVVSFAVGGVPELVLHKKNGYIAKYQDGNDLGNGLDWILGLSVDKLEKMSLSNRSRIKQHFSISKMVGSYVKLLKI